MVSSFSSKSGLKYMSNVSCITGITQMTYYYDQNEQANEGFLDINQDIQPAGRATISMVWYSIVATWLYSISSLLNGLLRLELGVLEELHSEASPG